MRATHGTDDSMDALFQTDYTYTPWSTQVARALGVALFILAGAVGLLGIEQTRAQTVSEITDSNSNTILHLNQSGSVGDGFVGVNRSSVIGNEVFGVQADVGAQTYGGMYMETTDPGGFPFYGYATDGSSTMWTYYDGASGNWKVYNSGDRLTVKNDGFVGVNRETRLSPEEEFGVQADAGAGEYGGMYMETNDPDGLPFYGYATDGSSAMWTYYDGASDNWKVYNSGDRLTVRNDGFVGVNRETQITSFEEFGVQADAGAGEYGGIYMETTNPGGFPFYGYAADGTAKAYTYLDPSANEWYLNIDGGGDVMAVDNSGNMQIDGTLTESSDRRLKTSIEPLSSVLESLADIRPVRFHFNENTGNSRNEQIGLIAQDVQKEFPELINEGSDGYLSLSYSKLSAVLLKGLQEQQSQIADLKSENERIKERLATLEAKMSTPKSVVAGLGGLWGFGIVIALGLGGLVGASFFWRRGAEA